MGHMYPIVSIDCHEHVMTSMMGLRHGYSLICFGPSDARKPCQGMDHPRDCVTKNEIPRELGRCVTSWKGITGFLKGLCSREGNVEEYIFFGN